MKYFWGIWAFMFFAFSELCSASSVINCDDNVCYSLKIPSYGQNDAALDKGYFVLSDGSTNLCGPTSVSMVMMAVFGSLDSSIMGNLTSWVQTEFFNSSISSAQKIERIAEAFDSAKLSTCSGSTSCVSGVMCCGSNHVHTGLVLQKMISDSRQSIARSQEQGTNQDVAYQSFCSLREKIRPKTEAAGDDPFQLMIIQYGHYYRKSEVAAGVTVSVYRRSGGHFVVGGGQYYDKIKIYDPASSVGSSQAIQSFEQISVMKKKVYEVGEISATEKKRGFLFDRTNKFGDVAYFPIIETYDFVEVPNTRVRIER